MKTDKLSVLIWVEPHPIRNYYDLFTRHIAFVLSALRASYGDDIRIHMSGNAQARRSLTDVDPTLKEAFVPFSSEDDAVIQSAFRRWDGDAMADWTDIVQGKPGPKVDFYSTLLEKILQAIDVDIILIWSDNGAVRDVARRKQIPVLSCELGPTRKNFGDTFYIDPSGTNGFAAVRDFPMHLVQGYENYAPETWAAMASTPLNERASVLELARYYPKDWDLPSKPFAFIPLQLADDLNTVIHSPYDSPLSFLQHVVPLCRAQGLDVVVKGHPFASAGARTSNLVAQHAALDYCLSQEDVHVVPRDATPLTTIPLLGNASVVLTINSSVGFEAVLLGRPVLLFGEAAFDIGGRLRWRDGDQLTEKTASDYASEAAFLWRHYLHPMEPTEGGKSLRSIIELTLDRSIEPLTEAYWRSWMDRIDHAREAVVRGMASSDPRSLERSVDHGDFALTRVTNTFEGKIDSVETPERQDGGSTVKVSGWVTAKDGTRPVHSVLLLSDDIAFLSTDILESNSAMAEKMGTPNPVYRFTLEGPLRDVERSSIKFAVMGRDGHLQAGPLRTGHIGVEPPDDAPDGVFDGYIESVDAKEYASFKQVLVRAWIIDTVDLSAPAAVVVLCDGEVIAGSSLFQPRPDVAARYGLKMIKCGVELEFPAPRDPTRSMGLAVVSERKVTETFELAAGRLTTVSAARLRRSDAEQSSVIKQLKRVFRS